MRRYMWIAATALALVAGCRSNPFRPSSYQKPVGPDFVGGPELTGPVMDLPPGGPGGYSYPMTGPTPAPPPGTVAVPPGSHPSQPYTGQPYPAPMPYQPTPGSGPQAVPAPIPQGPMPRRVPPSDGSTTG